MQPNSFAGWSPRLSLICPPDWATSIFLFPAGSPSLPSNDSSHSLTNLLDNPAHLILIPGRPPYGISTPFSSFSSFSTFSSLLSLLRRADGPKKVRGLCIVAKFRSLFHASNIVLAVYLIIRIGAWLYRDGSRWSEPSTDWSSSYPTAFARRTKTLVIQGQRTLSIYPFGNSTP